MYASRTPFRPRCLVRRHNSPKRGGSEILSPPTSPVATRRRLKFRWMRFARELTKTFTLSFASEISIVADTFVRVTVVISRKFFRKWKLRAKWARWARSIAHRAVAESVSFAFSNFDRMRRRDQWVSLANSVTAKDQIRRVSDAHDEFLASRKGSLAKRWRKLARKMRRRGVEGACEAAQARRARKSVLRTFFLVWMQRRRFQEFEVPQMSLHVNIGVEFGVGHLVTVPDTGWVSVLDDVKRCKEDAINEFCWFVVDEMGVKVPEFELPRVSVNGCVGDVRAKERRDVQEAAEEMKKLWFRVPEVRFPFFGLGAENVRDRNKAEKRAKLCDTEEAAKRADVELVIEKPKLEPIHVGESGRMYRGIAKEFADENTEGEMNLELERDDVCVSVHPLVGLSKQTAVHYESVLRDADEIGRLYSVELKDFVLDVCFRCVGPSGLANEELSSGGEMRLRNLDITVPIVRIEPNVGQEIVRHRNAQIEGDLEEIRRLAKCQDKMVLDSSALLSAPNWQCARAAIPKADAGYGEWHVALVMLHELIRLQTSVDSLCVHYQWEPIPNHSENDAHSMKNQWTFALTTPQFPIGRVGLPYHIERAPDNTERDAQSISTDWEIASKNLPIEPWLGSTLGKLSCEYQWDPVPSNTERDAKSASEDFTVSFHPLCVPQIHDHTLRNEAVPDNTDRDVASACASWDVQLLPMDVCIPNTMSYSPSDKVADVIKNNSTLEAIMEAGSNLWDWKAIWDMETVNLRSLEDWQKAYVPPVASSAPVKRTVTEEWNPDDSWNDMVWDSHQVVNNLKLFRFEESDADLGDGKILTQSGSLPELLRSVSGISKLENFDYFRDSIHRLVSRFTGRMFLKTRYPPYVLTLVSRQMKIINRYSLPDKLRDPTNSRIFEPRVGVRDLVCSSPLEHLHEFECLTPIELFDPDLFLAQHKSVTYIVPKTRFYAHIFAYVALDCAVIANMSQRACPHVKVVRTRSPKSGKRVRRVKKVKHVKRRLPARRTMVVIRNVPKKILRKKIVMVPKKVLRKKKVTVTKIINVKKIIMVPISECQENVERVTTHFSEALDSLMHSTLLSVFMRGVEDARSLEMQPKTAKRVAKRQKVTKSSTKTPKQPPKQKKVTTGVKQRKKRKPSPRAKSKTQAALR